MDEGTVRSWATVQRRLAEAERALVLMRDPAAAQPERDRATADYVRASDALVAELLTLSRSGTLAAVGRLLRDPGGGVL